eukprot:TRINITY_DN12991_c0_g4_i2.p1 TRINITY_DN12991_c0_g4~~TRINITY_DN12991_c0_g4_i2.p1  ORF type:complete len:101 (+),score=18.46 TRINITY_DN12991_c0_g4_i2:67-369(+)
MWPRLPGVASGFLFIFGCFASFDIRFQDGKEDHARAHTLCDVFGGVAEETLADMSDGLSLLQLDQQVSFPGIPSCGTTQNRHCTSCNDEHADEHRDPNTF